VIHCVTMDKALEDVTRCYRCGSTDIERFKTEHHLDTSAKCRTCGNEYTYQWNHADTHTLEEMQDIWFQGYKVSHDDTPIAYEGPEPTYSSVKEIALSLLTMGENLFHLQAQVADPEELERFVKARSHVAMAVSALETAERLRPRNKRTS
jgi:predicted RNA-binding Zn-ribbon protein involved in translation (DUF1610 family)